MTPPPFLATFALIGIVVAVVLVVFCLGIFVGESLS